MAASNYQLTKCPICRVESTAKQYRITTLISRFLSKYMPYETLLAIDDGQDAQNELIDLMESCTAMEQECQADFFESGVQDRGAKEALKIQTKAAELEQMNTYFASTFCVLCSEPLDYDLVCTTPCKHHFHMCCVLRLDRPACPLCDSALPFEWYLPKDHPLQHSGFKVCSCGDRHLPPASPICAPASVSAG